MYDLLSTLDVSKSNGHDDISALMLKETALSIYDVISDSPVQCFNQPWRST